tara:strand:- start:363 stop:746 length:384 start_codon:yes stop_codon:yes gene_type:complete
MLEVKLEIVDNGIIKTVKDNNYNSAGQSREFRKVYETENDKEGSYTNTMKLFYEISDDLGIDMGNKFDNKVLDFRVSWGSHYEPNFTEVKNAIKEHSEELRYLRGLEKAMKNNRIADEIIKDQKNKI